MNEIRIGWRVTTPHDGDGAVIKIELKPKGNLVHVKHDCGRITCHYQRNLRSATSGANTTYANAAPAGSR